MDARARIVGATLVVVVNGACSPAAVGPTASPVSPSAAATASSQAPTASLSAAPVACDDQTTGCAGPLSPGDHRTANFDHPFSFTVGRGWRNGRDLYRAYTLWSDQAPDTEFIVWSHAAPAMQTPDCSAARRPGFGTSVAEWIRSLTSDDRLDVTKKETFQLGSHAATRVEVTTKPTFTAMCPFNTDPFAVIVTDTENPPTRAHGGRGPVSMTFVDFGDDAIVIWIETADHMVELSSPVVESIQFQN